MIDTIECKENVEIKNYTTYKIGGLVKNVYFPKNQQEFVTLLKDLKEYIVLGNCSNVLISSNGYDGNIILTSQMKDFDIKGTRVYVSCGVKGPAIAKEVCEKSLSGFEFMIAFPGSIGGEVYMNASAHGQCISDSILNCCVYDKKAKDIVFLTKEEMQFSYRHSILQEGRYILLGVEFELKKQVSEEIQSIMDRNLTFRKDVQPSLAYPNAGSVFKNPPNDSAGRLLDKAGAKNFKTDKVAVWENHANFIINKGDATSEDVLELMVKMYNAVKDNYTIQLIPEVIFIGNKTKKEEELCKILYQKTQK